MDFRVSGAHFVGCMLGCPPAQDASHRQDLSRGIPTETVKNAPGILGGGTDPKVVWIQIP